MSSLAARWTTGSFWFAHRLRTCVRAASERLTRRLTLCAFAVALAFHLSQSVESWLREELDEPLWHHVAYFLIVELPGAVCMLFATLIADEFVTRGAPRARSYLIGVMVGAAVLALLESSMYTWFPYPGADASQTVETMLRSLGAFLNFVLWGGMFTFIYVNLHTARIAAARMHDAQLRRAQIERRTFESRLQALQARVEPGFLFNTLAQVRALYAADMARGRQMLDSLIDYLRAALPHLRDSTSTLGREADLARAYLDIVRVRTGDLLAYSVTVPAEFAASRTPPMMLLPLIDHALTHGQIANAPSTEPSSPTVERTRSIAIDASVDAGTLRISVWDDGRGFAPDQQRSLRSIDERLYALYGNRAALRFQGLAGSASEAVLEIPLEAAGA